MVKVTKEQIEDWKKEHGQIFRIDVEDKFCILKKPNRRTLSMAMKMSAKDPMKFNDVLLKNCWLAGDEEIKTDDGLFLAVSQELDLLVEQKTAEIKEL